MEIYGNEFAAGETAKAQFVSFKLLFNQSAIAFFSQKTQHNQAGFSLLPYQNDQSGGVLAGNIKPGSVEIRRHTAFKEAASVGQIFTKFRNIPELQWLKNLRVTYGGAEILAAETPAP